MKSSIKRLTKNDTELRQTSFDCSNSIEVSKQYIIMRQMFEDKEQCMTKAEANEQPQKFPAGCCMLGVAWLGWKCNIQIKQYPTRHQSKYHYEPNHNMKSAVISPS